MSDWQKRWDKFRIKNEVPCDDFISEGYYATEVMEEFFKLETKSMQEEINRLTIAYQNASDQRAHYVDKCLKLSEVVLDYEKVYGQMWQYFQCSEQCNSNDSWAKKCTCGASKKSFQIREIINKHKDLIDELKRNLELKSE